VHAMFGYSCVSKAAGLSTWLALYLFRKRCVNPNDVWHNVERNLKDSFVWDCMKVVNEFDKFYINLHDISSRKYFEKKNYNLKISKILLLSEIQHIVAFFSFFCTYS